MSGKSREDLNAQITANLADNNQGDISAADVRGVALDSSDSLYNFISDTSDTIEEGAVNLFLTLGEREKIASVEEGAQVNSVLSVVGIFPDEEGDITIDKDSINLGNVDNTSDADKPVSDIQQEALDLKVASDIAGIEGAGKIINAIFITQSDYDNLTPDAQTLYVITDA